MKKTIKIGILACFSLLMCSCEDIFQVEYPELYISFADSDRVDLDGVLQAYTDQQIYINMSGDMDILYQYDGTAGCQYLTDDEICTTGGTAMVQFRSSLAHIPSERQEDVLEFKISTDFTGIKDSLNILNATWITIPKEDHNGFDTVGDATNIGVTITTEAWSDWINIYDYLPGDQDSYDYVYFAYHYNSKTYAETGLWGPRWTVRYFDFRRTYEDGRYQYYGLYDPVETANDMTEHFYYAGFLGGTDWNACDAGSGNAWALTSRLTATAGQCDYAQFIPNQTEEDLFENDWLISREFDLHLAPANDYAVSLKGTTDDIPSFTTVSYADPGVYTISIIAKNLTIKHEKQVVKRLVVNVTDPGN